MNTVNTKIEKQMTMIDVIGELARLQAKDKDLPTDDRMLALAASLDFAAVSKALANQKEMVLATTYFADMAEAGVVPRDLVFVLPVLRDSKEARQQMNERKVTVYF